MTCAHCRCPRRAETSGEQARRFALLLLASLSVIAFFGAIDGALAQTSPFGGMRPSQPAPELGGIVGWLLAKQAEFYRALSGLIRAAKVDGTAIWGLLGVSFLYGVFHAAGPGHGKAVISSYLLANEETWRRGVTLSFASALLQALVAVAVVGIAAVVFNATKKTMDQATAVIEIASYGLIALVGARLTWVKGGAFLRAFHQWFGAWRRDVPQPAYAHAHASGAHARLDTTHGHGHTHAYAPHDHSAHDHPAHDHSAHDHSAHDHSAHHARARHPEERASAECAAHTHSHTHSHMHAHSPGCDDHGHVHDEHCGHAHGPEPEQLAGRGGWRRGLSAIVAVGLRPCSGAILVLVFALAQGLFWAGVASTFVMGIGTAITVTAIATFTVAAKSIAKRLAAQRAGGGVVIMRGIEAGAAVLVLVFGLALLAGYIVTERMI